MKTLFKTSTGAKAKVKMSHMRQTIRTIKEALGETAQIGNGRPKRWDMETLKYVVENLVLPINLKLLTFKEMGINCVDAFFVVEDEFDYREENIEKLKYVKDYIINNSGGKGTRKGEDVLALLFQWIDYCECNSIV